MLAGTDFRPKHITSAKWMIWTVITQKERYTKMAEISQNERFRHNATQSASDCFFKARIVMDRSQVGFAKVFCCDKTGKIPSIPAC